MDFSANVRAAFNRAAVAYDKEALVQRTSAKMLADILPTSLDRPRICELGCGTGFLTTLLLQRFRSAEIIAIDASPAMLEQARRACRTSGDAPDRRVAFVEANVCEYALPRDLDLCVSSSSLQWMEPLQALFPRVRDALRPHGRCVFLLVLGGTYRELHALRRELFPEKIPSGRMRSAPEVVSLLEDAGLRVQQQAIRSFQLAAPSAWELMKSLSATGVACGAVSSSGTRLNRTELLQLAAEYEARFRRADGGGVVASYEVGLFDAVLADGKPAVSPR